MIYHFKHKSGLISFIGFKGPLGFYENTSYSYTALEKTRKSKEIKTDKRNSKSRENQKSKKVQWKLLNY